jgi:hypothetical protein
VSRINREKSAIAAGVARQQSDIAIYRSVMRRTRPARVGDDTRNVAPAGKEMDKAEAQRITRSS